MSVFFPLSRSAVWPPLLGVAVGLVAALLQWLVYPLVGSHMPFVFFMPALVFSAASLGRVPASMVLLIGAANAALLAPPTGSFAVDNPQEIAGLVIFGILGTLLVLYGGHLRITTRRAALAEKHLALAQDQTGVGVFELDFEGGTAYVSPSLCQMLDQPIRCEPVALHEWLGALGTRNVADAKLAMQERLSKGEMRYEREQRVELASGRVVWILNRVQLEATAGGALVQARGATIDITERKKAADELMAAKEKLREEVEDLKHVHVFSQRLVAAGDSLEAAAQSLLDLFMELYAVRHGVVALREPNSGLAFVVAQAGFSDHEASRVHAGGSCGAAKNTSDYPAMVAAHRVLTESGGFLDMQSHALMSGSGDMVGAISVMFAEPPTRSERRVRLCEVCAMTAAAVMEGIRSRAAAAITERRFSVALESSIVPFTIIAPVYGGDGRIVDFEWSYINAAAAGALGRDAKECLGRRIGEMLPRAWEPRGQFERYVRVAETGEPCQFEVCTHATNQGARWYSIVASALQGSVAVWFANITDRKIYEEALEAAAKRKDEFLATLAHELRNPLGAIRQGVQISRAMASTDAQKRLGLAVIDRQVTQMSLLLDDLLDVARVGRGTLLLRKSKEPLAVLIDTAIETARPHIEAKHHHLEVDLPHSRIILDVDPLRMTQVIANLVVNAAKYTDAGGQIRLSADLDEGALAIRVRDNGMGLTNDQIDQVFDMYAQIPAAREKSQGGLGIGLALARGLIELHDGSITANSGGPGQGAEFIVHLPPSCVTIQDAPTDPTAASVAQPRGQAATILIADDNRDAADSLAELLRLDGHQVHVAYDGDEALEAYTRVAPDAALLDMDMPGLSGAELARAIRKSPAGVPTLLIAVTGRGQEKDREMARRAGFDHHLTKPMDPERIQSLIEMGLASRTAQSLSDSEQICQD